MDRWNGRWLPARCRANLSRVMRLLLCQTVTAR
jgi:hypothetical protein